LILTDVEVLNKKIICELIISQLANF